MPVYKYKALNREGKVIKGEIEALSLEDFFAYLSQEGLIPIKYSTKFSFLENRIKRITRKEIAEFCHNLASVGLHGFGADFQVECYLLCGFSFCEEL